MDQKKKLTIGGKEYEVKYLFGSFAAMHEKYQINVFDLPDPTPHMIAVLIWGAVIHVEPLITPKEITAKLTMQEAMDGNNTCIAAIIECLPKKKVVETHSSDQVPA